VDPRLEHGRHSRYLSDTARLSSPLTATELFPALRRLKERWNGMKPVLLPVSDPYAALIDDGQAELRSDFELRSPPSGLLGRFVDKIETHRLCQQYGVQAPATVVAEGMQAVRDACRVLEFPVIVKPRRTYGTGFPGKNRALGSAVDLLRFFEANPIVLGNAVIQQIIPSGDGHIIYVGTYSNGDGEVVAVWTGRKLRQWQPDFGMTCFGVSEEHGVVRDRVRTFLDAIGYQGVAGLEFARDRRTGEYFFLELNPRLFLPIQLAADSGVDLVRLAYRDMCGDPIETMPRQRDGIYWLDFTNDLQSFAWKRRRGILSASEWLRSLLRARSFAAYDVRDPKPFVASLVHLLAFLSKGLVARIRRYAGRSSGSAAAFPAFVEFLGYGSSAPF
jgi:predicted ATP-grasp superfamily ATP-dependent carboligase